MTKFKKYIAWRLVALLMFPYSASAAAACNTQLDYSTDTGPDFAYESAAYHIGQPEQADACTDTSGTLAEQQTGVSLPSFSTTDDFPLQSI